MSAVVLFPLLGLAVAGAAYAVTRKPPLSEEEKRLIEVEESYKRRPWTNDKEPWA